MGETGTEAGAPRCCCCSIWNALAYTCGCKHAASTVIDQGQAKRVRKRYIVAQARAAPSRTLRRACAGRMGMRASHRSQRGIESTFALHLNAGSPHCRFYGTRSSANIGAAGFLEYQYLAVTGCNISDPAHSDPAPGGHPILAFWTGEVQVGISKYGNVFDMGLPIRSSI
ncbi:hypothetical protein HYPSUDRAFT_954805 [Hypholoma sublateritium FD-334 SS-4]|uniref:Uncharacterized protein n=1 Tax=Hypholoma sublateritium (strain FD-334 SS-4) TaxID=945553 RepID=A0A0D2M5M1_HYPSF|nr:hypothetical protein HYPSUDRAFT_954805 [Hypholoma sublateritium FD-334 SS-4]